MSVTGFLREDFKQDDPVRKVASARQARRIARILNGIEGIGCRIEKPTSMEGYGWKIIVDAAIGENGRVVTDTESYSTGKNPDGRMTVERNPETYVGDPDWHKTRVQLRNIQNVLQQSSSMPFFVSGALQGAVPDKVVGELYWAQVDAKRYDDSSNAIYKSLDVTNIYTDTSKGKWNLGLYDFYSSASCSAPYSIHATHGGHTDKTLTWQVPVAIGGNAHPYPFPGIPGTVTYVSSAAATWTSGSYASIQLNTRSATVSNGTLNFGTSDTLGAEVKADVTLSSTDVNSAAHHDQIQGTAASALHDGRYLHREGRSTDKWASYNQCESIANNISGKNGISFANGILYDASNVTSVHYASRLLYDSAPKVSVDWQTRTLKDNTEAITADWNAKGLVGRWSLGSSGSGDGAYVAVNASSTGSFQVQIPGGNDCIKAYNDSGPRTEIRGLRLYARNSTSIYFDLEIEDGVLTFRDHTGANCGELRRSL